MKFYYFITFIGILPILENPRSGKNDESKQTRLVDDIILILNKFRFITATQTWEIRRVIFNYEVRKIISSGDKKYFIIWWFVHYHKIQYHMQFSWNRQLLSNVYYNRQVYFKNFDILKFILSWTLKSMN